MRLDLRELIASPGGRKDFSFALDPTDLTFDGVLGYASPITVTGAVENHAGLLTTRACLPSARSSRRTSTVSAPDA